MVENDWIIDLRRERWKKKMRGVKVYVAQCMTYSSHGIIFFPTAKWNLHTKIGFFVSCIFLFTKNWFVLIRHQASFLRTTNGCAYCDSTDRFAEWLMMCEWVSVLLIVPLEPYIRHRHTVFAAVSPCMILGLYQIYIRRVSRCGYMRENNFVHSSPLPPPLSPPSSSSSHRTTICLTHFAHQLFPQCFLSPTTGVYVYLHLCARCTLHTSLNLIWLIYSIFFSPTLNDERRRL